MELLKLTNRLSDRSKGFPIQIYIFAHQHAPQGPIPAFAFILFDLRTMRSNFIFNSNQLYIHVYLLILIVGNFF